MRRPLVLTLLIAASASPAAAQTSPDPAAPPTREALAEARVHFERGITLHERGDDDGAVAELELAWSLSRRPSVLFNLGVALQGLHRDVEALDTFRRFMNLEARPRARLRREAEAAITVLDARVARLRVEVSPAGAVVRVDDRVITPPEEVLLNAGEHRISATQPGYRSAEERVVVSPGERRVWQVTLAPEETAVTPIPQPLPTGTLTLEGTPPEAVWTVDGVTQPTTSAITVLRGAHEVRVASAAHLPWQGSVQVQEHTTLRVRLTPSPDGLVRRMAFVSFGVAGALALGAAVTGALAMRTHDAFTSRTQDAPDLDALASRGVALSVSADVLGALALVGVATGVLLFVRGDATPQPSTGVVASAQGVGLRF